MSAIEVRVFLSCSHTAVVHPDDAAQSAELDTYIWCQACQKYRLIHEDCANHECFNKEGHGRV